MTADKLFFSNDLSSLKAVALKTPKAGFEGAWSTLELQLDIFSPQRFTVGVAVQAHGERLYFKLLSDFKKFECVYRDPSVVKSVKHIMEHAQVVLSRAINERTSIPEVEFDTSALSLSMPQFTSGSDAESIAKRLFADVVVMSIVDERKQREFEYIDTVHARKLVNDELKRIAKLDFERIVLPENAGVLVEENGERHFLDFNLRTINACGSVTSAVYQSPMTVELNLLKSSRDLTTYSRIKGCKSVGLFMLLPEEGSMDAKSFTKIQSKIDEYEWKLERDGFQVSSFSSPISLAEEIYDWAKPSLV
jgi:hypothetical protein